MIGLPIGPGSFILIFIIVLLIFGSKRLPQIGRAAGETVTEFKEATKGLTDKCIERKEYEGK